MSQGFALITGGSSGIGAAYARRLAERGYDLILVSNRREELHGYAQRLQQEFAVEVRTLCLDLTESDAAEQLYAWCQGWNLRVEVLINNAGMLLFNRLEHTPLESLDRIVALHCTTPTKLCRLFGEEMAARGRGHILLMSSITAWTPYPTISHYAASKAYLKSFGQALWYEMRERGVQVTTVFPSAVDTPFYPLEDRVRRRLCRLGLMLSADRVASLGLKALFGGRRRCLPGFVTRLEAAICWVLPAWALLPILKIPAVRRILERV